MEIWSKDRKRQEENKDMGEEEAGNRKKHKVRKENMK
jgi:hypothetical protein